MLRESSRTGKRLSCFLLSFLKKQSDRFLVAKKYAVIPNLIRNRKIEVDKPESCRRKHNFQALAALNQVQGDNFCVIYGICAKINTNEHQNQIQHSPLRT